MGLDFSAMFEGFDIAAVLGGILELIMGLLGLGA